MITSRKKILNPLVLGTIVLTLNACTPAVQNPDSDNGNSSNNPIEENTNGEDPSNDEVLELVFGVYTADKPTTVVKEFLPTLNALEVEMSEILDQPVEIKMEVANSYEGGISDLVNGNVDFSRLGPASYVTAKQQNPNLSILGIETKNGEKIFNGVIAVHNDSDITDVSQLKGKSFAFGDQLSTIGRFLSQNYLVEHGITSSNLSRFDYLERHDKVGTAVDLRQFDAGALKESTFNKLVKNGTSIRAIAKFPNVQKPWVASSELAPETSKAINEALLSIDDPEVLKTLGIDSIVNGTDEDYQKIREAIESNEKFFQ